MLAGNSYINLVGPSDTAPPKELWVLRPDRMKIVPNSVSGVGAYDYTVGGKTVRISGERVLHMKTFHPLDDWYGLSPIEVAARAIDTDNEALKWNKALLQNSARPSGAFVAKDVLNENEHGRMKKEITEAYTGSANAGKFMLMEGVEWKQMGVNPVDMDWLNGRKLTKREICQVFQVPAELIGDGEMKTYSNYQEARKSFYHETVLPLMSRIRDDFNNFITPRFNDRIKLDYSLDNVPALAEEQALLWERVNSANHTTINEKRRLTGFDEVDGGDVILVSATMIPLEAASAPEPQGPQPTSPPSAQPTTGKEGTNFHITVMTPSQAGVTSTTKVRRDAQGRIIEKTEAFATANGSKVGA